MAYVVTIRFPKIEYYRHELIDEIISKNGTWNNLGLYTKHRDFEKVAKEVIVVLSDGREVSAFDLYRRSEKVLGVLYEESECLLRICAWTDAEYVLYGHVMPYKRIRNYCTDSWLFSDNLHVRVGFGFDELCCFDFMYDDFPCNICSYFLIKGIRIVYQTINQVDTVVAIIDDEEEYLFTYDNKFKGLLAKLKLLGKADVDSSWYNRPFN